jgi:hypothetical protein
MSTTSDFPHIPFSYILLFLWYEPLAAFGGAMLCHFDAPRFLNTMTATAVYQPSSQVIFDQLAATYVLFAFNEGIVLRMVKDLRVWKIMITGMLACDVLHLYASWIIMGTSVFVRPWVWRAEDWLAVGTMWVPLLVRAAFLKEIGFKRTERQGRLEGNDKAVRDGTVEMNGQLMANGKIEGNGFVVGKERIA